MQTLLNVEGHGVDRRADLSVPDVGSRSWPWAIGAGQKIVLAVMVNEPPPTSRSSSTPVHPFANSKSLLEIIPDKIDVEEESRLYDELCYVRLIIIMEILTRGGSLYF